MGSDRQLLVLTRQSFAQPNVANMSSTTVPTNDQIMVPETLLKKRKSQEKARAERTEAQEKRQVIFQRAEKYVKEYRDAEREKIRLSRAARTDDSVHVPAEARLIFVVRIK